ncbi:MAG: DUF4091 domain-containing protein [Planctomycetes bacterium]|nr:DUF4091 domain-containing protein [Planctomycetota bacterium]
MNAPLGRRTSLLARSAACVAPLFLLLTACRAPQAAPPTVWVVDGAREILADSGPSFENEVYSASRGVVTLTAAINETVALQIALRSDTPPAGPFNIHITDLTGSAGTLDARSTVTIYRAHYVPVERFRSWYPDHTGRPALPTAFPDILVPWEAPRGGGPLRLDSSRNEIIWIDLHVPPTTDPGEYTGRIELRGIEAQPLAEAETVFACELRLRVLPVAIPGARGLPVICRVEPTDLLSEHMRWPRAQARTVRLLPGTPRHRAPIDLVNAAMALFHEHRATPVLWGSFPKFRLTGDRSVEVDWEHYDRLVAPWIDGTGFSDRVNLSRWPIPVSLEHPAADINGGYDSPGYARLLATYLAECRRHFEQRGWLERSFVRLNPPADLTQDALDRVSRAGRIIRQSEAALPLVAHLPTQSLRGLGWHNAPALSDPNIDIWAPPAMWFEPGAMRRRRDLGEQTWFMPDQPPYSASLAVEAPAVDPRALAWQAYRYEVDAIWIEHAAEFGATSADGQRPRDALIYSGVPYGLMTTPVPSARLKRLRRGLQDYELLRLLETSGKRLFARSIANQIVRWAHTDACLDHLLSCKEAGWSTDPSLFQLARKILLQELVNTFEPDAAGQSRQSAHLARLARIMNQASRVRAAARGVRLDLTDKGFRLRVLADLANDTSRTIRGSWKLESMPLGWRQTRDVPVTIPPGERLSSTIECALSGLGYNIDGAFPFVLNFDTENFGAFAATARLAVAACPLTDRPPTVDGDLSDWMLATNNAAGDFRLCRGRRRTQLDQRAGVPTLPTQAYVCMDRERLYIGIRCGLRGGRRSPEKPLWKADNTVPIDGIIPWGQDVVEILIDPRNSLDGGTSDLFILQIKPNGLLIARKGARTDPPVGRSTEWDAGAVTAIRTEREAWTVEVSLPLAALPPAARQNRIWGFNITRLDARRGEYSSWSGARGHCYSSRSLGNLVLQWP